MPVSEIRSALAEKRQGRLYSLLFDEEVLREVPVRELTILLLDRFKGPISGDPSERDREIVRRLGILKALSRRPSVRSDQALVGVYRDLLQKEPFLVRRQLLRNLMPYLTMMKPQERDQLLLDAGERAIASAAWTDEEILELHEAR